MEKSVSETLLQRRCVRHYENRAIPEEDMRFIREAVRNTPTSYNGQQYSVIEITDQPIKEKMAEISAMKQLATAPLVLMFLVDYHKIAVAAKDENLEMPPFYNSADGLIVGVIDASLAMMGAIVAAESRGLGTCPVGYIRTVAPNDICKLLKLPKEVFPICALAIGIPANLPQLKPKEPLDLLFFKNVYGVQDMPEKLRAYNEKVIQYHQTRASHASDQDWLEKTLFYYKERVSANVLPALKAQGFALDK